MAEKFRFFDPVQLPDGTYDREYNAQEFTDYFKALITTGIMKSVGDQLAVTTNGTNMVSSIANGIAFILGRYYENDSVVNLTHDTETLGNSRIDRVVIRMDLSPDKRHVLSFIKKGAPSANPVPPSLTQTANIYEISLAQVRIVGGQTFIASNAVTDERGKDIICPWAGSNILPSFDDNALANHINNQQIHVTQSKQEKWDSYSILKYRGFLQGAVNFDNVLEAGFYHVADTPGATNKPPVTDWSLLYVYKSDEAGNSYVEQEIKSVSGNMGVTYFRVRTETTWSPWCKRLDERDITLPTPTTASLIGGWEHSNINDPLRFYKDSFGVVHIYGRVRVAASNTGVAVTILPVGYRPLADKETLALSGVSTPASISVTTFGQINTFMSMTVGNSILINISFPTTIR